MEMPELVRASDGKRVAPWKDGHGYPTVGTQCEPALEDYSVSVRFEGGMGPFVVASVNYYINAGGAHGLRGQEFVAIDLDAGGAKKLSPPERTNRRSSRAQRRAFRSRSKRRSTPASC